MLSFTPEASEDAGAVLGALPDLEPSDPNRSHAGTILGVMPDLETADLSDPSGVGSILGVGTVLERAEMEDTCLDAGTEDVNASKAGETSRYRWGGRAGATSGEGGGGSYIILSYRAVLCFVVV